MIKRYQNPKIEEIFARSNEVRIQLELVMLEVDGCEDVPFDYFSSLPAGYFDERISEIEKDCRHDVVAMHRALSEELEKIGYKDYNKVHGKCTSSDIVDSSVGVQCARAQSVIQDLQMGYFSELSTRAESEAPTYGRTHGRKAITMLEGDRFVSMYNELRSLPSRSHRFKMRLGGPVGNTFSLKEKEKFSSKVRERLGVKLELDDTTGRQCVPRSEFAMWAAKMAVLSSVLERHATYIRLHLIEGVEEYEVDRGREYRGSSSMPFKNNPTELERVCGMARIVRGYSQGLMESVPLWHERDISHSCVDRVAIPGIFHAVASQLTDLTNVLGSLRFVGSPPSLDNDKAVLGVHKKIGEGEDRDKEWDGKNRN